jgi:anti-sigma B factor antagonist
MESLFQVDPHSDPVYVCVRGKANYLNCAPLGDFFDRLLSRGIRRFVVDFTDCEGMDSTFLGILAGTALELRKAEPGGEFILQGVTGRNFDLIRNLGLDRILKVSQETVESGARPLESVEPKAAAAKLLLRAHRNLVQADGANQSRFQDVIEFLSRDAGED